tara:strand:+ start:577 stop:930 length:354 start_codon:yes stop_codon:yes gene_type:complete
MKNKNIEHPRIYLKVIEKNNSIYLDYIDNEFNQSGERIVKSCIFENSKNKIQYIKDSNTFLNQLNSSELIKTNNYIKIQNKVLDYHIKKNNYDSVDIVKDSIKLMEEFKQQLLSNEF